MAAEDQQGSEKQEQDAAEEAEIALQRKAEGLEQQYRDEVRPVQHGEGEEDSDLVDEEEREDQDQTGQEVSRIGGLAGHGTSAG